jgi:uncharacterized protein YaiI (UPF0178 family)
LDHPAVLTVYVDGDACPVKDEVERVAGRHGLPVVIVSNGGLRPSRNPSVRHVTVDAGPDAADDWIAGHAGEGDLVVTADIPLADRVLKTGGRALGPSGHPFTADNIGTALGMRDFQRHLREASGGQTYNAGFTPKDRSRFLGAIENELQALRRRYPGGTGKA